MRLALCNLWRRPLLPVLLMIFLAGSVCCLTLFENNIQRNRQTVDELYESMQLRYRVLPGNASSGGELNLTYYTAEDIEDMAEVASGYGVMESEYSLRMPENVPGLSVVYGTEVPDWFAGERALTITYAEGWDGTAFQSDAESGEIPCIMDVSLQEMLGLEPGQTFSVAGYRAGENDSNAPAVSMVLAGVFVNGSVEPMSLIVPEWLFLQEGQLLHSLRMREMGLRYTEFWFELKPEYNRYFDQIEDQVKEILDKKGNYLLYGNTRELTNAVRPLERKGEFQQKLVLPMEAAFCVIVILTDLLYALSLREEIFLRLLWGEKRGRILFKNFICLCMPDILGGVPGLGIAMLLPGGRGRMAQLCAYMGVCVFSGIAAAMIVVLCTCKANLIRLYQQREE